MELLRDNDIVLEVCPTMNITTGTVKSWEEMQTILHTFWENEVKFTINTDGPYLAQTGLAKEYRLLFEKKILTEKQLNTCLDNAKEASFLDRTPGLTR